MVNWCPVSKSAISDEEVIHKELNGKLWYFRYPITDKDDCIVVATTRPETMLGDTAVAVHPDDDRYKSLIGKTVTLPLVSREIPIIADAHVDPEFGTGCVKVTPAHDPNDFSMGKHHNLEFINIMNNDASLNTNVPSKFQSLTREAAREAVVANLEAENGIDKIEDYTHNVGYSERGQVPIEYYMSEQWYLKMDELSKPALKAVNSGQIKFHPDHWKKTYNHWMENINDCVSVGSYGGDIRFLFGTTMRIQHNYTYRWMVQKTRRTGLRMKMCWILGLHLGYGLLAFILGLKKIRV